MSLKFASEQRLARNTLAIQIGRKASNRISTAIPNIKPGARSECEWSHLFKVLAELLSRSDRGAGREALLAEGLP